MGSDNQEKKLLKQNLLLKPKRQTTQRLLRLLISAILTYYFYTYSSLYRKQFQLDESIILNDNKISQSIKLPTTSHLTDQFENLIDLKNYRIPLNKHEINDLRDQLTFLFPYEPEKQIPKRIWQTWKVNQNDPNFPSKFTHFVKSWSNEIPLEDNSDGNLPSGNDKYEYTLIPDNYLHSLLLNLYGETPLIIKAFNEMPLNILKADFLRYLILFARGGIYSDMDTIPLKSFDTWPSVNKTTLLNWLNPKNSKLASQFPLKYKNFNPLSLSNPNDLIDPGFVIGIEADPDRDDWSDWYARRIQFCQWTIQSKPGHPILRELILNITATTLNSIDSTYQSTTNLIDQNFKNDYNINFRHKRQNDKNYNHLAKKNSKNIDGTDIMNWTGPGIFSDLILEYMNNMLVLNNNIKLFNTNLQVNRSPAQPSNAPDSQLESEDEPIDLMSTTQKFYKKITEDLQLKNKIPWEFFSLMDKPVMVDDIMILPITSFSPDVGQMGAKASDDKTALVKHMFSGSWKADADKNAENVKKGE
ncbi:hypothetical protein TBLA_0C04290 [Henningerozyma blattae CBS 6284]|uniref:Alpha-1,6-mannosyltransferase n=1 Tax=Henningerozyma blattae (strain ATCC 34711 / CBS 6284 / DSM 70876 / NBRC 10599 / NRRL Y-10934 / UCD 77-7) TaxID=1071380 RepID=I2H1H6_HENB6|nr:hypothetical protein TBLA_0C04290 [Tetrapisispora blattae CBS 6284]CCH60228.1 hypothetical protein TBLA_0C04290 [Tetrapisispora blattae CBS 6284]